MNGGAIISINNQRLRTLAVFAVLLLCAMLVAEPALAFDKAAGTIVKQTEKAIEVAQKILITAAVLALIIGLAPMLWGQVKVKWIISSLVACVLFGMTGTIVAAFAS